MNVSPVYHGAPAESRTPVEDRTYAALEELGIPFDRVDHDPAEDMADCAVISQALGADICKNLLLTPRNRSAFYLLAMPGDKPFVTKELSKQIGSSRLSFATAEELMEMLRTLPGAISPMGLLFDREKKVHLAIDRALRGEERLRPTFFAGFAVAMAGICLISFNGSALELDLRGDLLALLAAFVWACYALLSRKISALGHPTVLTTRRTFFYGLAFMLPALMVSGVRLELTRLTAPVNLGNLLFLGLGASALCFVTWNFAVKALGAVKTSVYIYLVPVITVAASVLILREPFTWMTGAGTVLTLIGLLLSEGKLHWKEGTHHETGTGQMRPGD